MKTDTRTLSILAVVLIVGCGDDRSRSPRFGGGTGTGMTSTDMGTTSDGVDSPSDTGVEMPPVVTGEPLQFQKIRPGSRHTCGLTLDGEVYCWGHDANTGSTERQYAVVPKRVELSATARDLAVGDGHSCALTETGQAWCWGGTERLPVESQARSFDTIVAAGSFTCGLDGGDVYCWGDNQFGQLGVAEPTSRETAELVPGVSDVESLAADDRTVCGVRTDGTVICWGEVLRGGQRDETAVVGALTDVEQLALWGRPDIALFRDGTVATFERRAASAADIVTTPISLPAAAKAVTAANQMRCALLVDGSAWCWGVNRFGRLGDGTTLDRDEPTRVGGVPAFEHLEAYDNVVCGIDADGAAMCWGDNTSGGLGGEEGTRGPHRIALDAPLTHISFSSIGTGITAAGELYRWGWSARLNQYVDDEWHLPPDRVVSRGWPNRFDALSQGGSSCGVTDGSLFCWGPFLAVDGRNVVEPEPTEVGFTQRFRAIAGGTFAMCGVASDDEIYCWGRNMHGELGVEDMTESATPVQIAQPGPFDLLAAGVTTMCGAHRDGTVYCWGEVVPPGEDRDRLQFEPVALGNADFVAIAAGARTVCGVVSDGTVQCAGTNLRGQLGDGTDETRGSLGTVPGIVGAKLIANGGSHVCVNTEEAEVLCWGENVSRTLGVGGRLGTDDRVEFRASPTKLDLEVEFTSMAASSRTTCGVAGADMWCWGANLEFLLATPPRAVPILRPELRE